MANSPSKILLAISGSIAAYKAADVVSLLKKQGHEVQCLLTESGARFVSPLVLETLSGNPAQTALFGPEISGTEHIRLARWADLLVFAPASAHLIARLALGLADDLVTTVALACEAPWLLAPAMNTVMWNQAVTQAHLGALRSRGARIVEPDSGALACGEVGVGKLASPERIVEAIGAALRDRDRARAPAPAFVAQDLRGLSVLITAGPTISHIDAVRYITNPSTGRMGSALAEEALDRGATVYYILGVDKGVVRPAPPPGTESRFKLTEVQTAEEMCQAAMAELPRVDGVIATAAVLDYRVSKSAQGKLKRKAEPVSLELVPSVDVLASLVANARPAQWMMGFAAETDDVQLYGQGKLERKKLQYLFANEVSRQGESLQTGFGTQTNSGWFFKRGSLNPVSLSLKTKAELARELWDLIAQDLKRPEGHNR